MNVKKPLSFKNKNNNLRDCSFMITFKKAKNFPKDDGQSFYLNSFDKFCPGKQLYGVTSTEVYCGCKQSHVVKFWR